MTTIKTTVGELVRAEPNRARIFEKLGIDYCCGGKKPLDEVCAAKGLDATTVLAMLDTLAGAAAADLIDADSLELAALCDHIEQAHHDYLREELPRLDFMTRKVAAVHGDHEPRLLEIRELFARMAPELATHIVEEEEQLFPRIRQLAGGSPSDCEDLRAQLNQLETEHLQAGAALAQFRVLTDGYSPPDWACNTFRALYDGLARLEANMHQHVHKENNILFPRALAAA